jgi:hypothetical protein
MACRTVTPPARPGSAPPRALPSRTTITGWAIRSEVTASRTWPTNVRAAPARSRHQPVGRDPTTLAASIRSTAPVWSMASPGRRARVANCAQHGWVPRHLSGRMQGDAQPGARQWRGVQPGHRLQGDGVSPTDQGDPGIVDGDGGDRPHRIRLGLGGGCEGKETEPLRGGGNSSPVHCSARGSRSGTYPLVALLRVRLNRGAAVLFPKLWRARRLLSAL